MTTFTPTTSRIIAAKATWEMTPEEMAHVVADSLGWDYGSIGTHGGWVYTDATRERWVDQGWENIAARMVAANWILPGRGINWQQINEVSHGVLTRGKPPRVTFTPKVTRKPRKVTRTIKGIKWLSQGDQHWISEDGQWTIVYDEDFMTDCEGPHPVKISHATRKAFWADTQWERDHRWPSDIRFAIEAGRKGYMCDGGQEHTYSLWVAGATTGEPQVISRGETFKGAAESVARHIETGEIWA